MKIRELYNQAFNGATFMSPSESDHMTWQERFRQKWEGANTGGYNAISTPVMDEIIKDIFQAVEEERNRIIEMIEKRRMENRKFSMGVWDGADASYRDILSIINQTK